MSAFPDHEELPIIVSKQLHHNVCNVCFTEFRKKEKKKKKRKKWHAFIPRTDLTFVVHSGDQEIGETSRVSSSRCCSQPLGRRTLGTRDISGQFNPVSFLLFKFFYSILFRSGLFFSRLRAVTKLRRTNLIVVRVALFLAAQPFFFLSFFFFFSFFFCFQPENLVLLFFNEKYFHKTAVELFARRWRCSVPHRPPSCPPRFETK